MKLTGWYRPDQKPVRVGWYMVNAGEPCFFFWWSGKAWHLEKDWPALKLQTWEWRGIDRLSQKYNDKSFK